MIEETDFETFLYISKNKYQIFVNDKKNLKNLYNKEVSGDYTAEYNDWIDLIGGEQNLMLRNFQ